MFGIGGDIQPISQRFAKVKFIASELGEGINLLPQAAANIAAIPFKFGGGLVGRPIGKIKTGEIEETRGLTKEGKIVKETRKELEGEEVLFPIIPETIGVGLRTITTTAEDIGLFVNSKEGKEVLKGIGGAIISQFMPGDRFKTDKKISEVKINLDKPGLQLAVFGAAVLGTELIKGTLKEAIVNPVGFVAEVGAISGAIVGIKKGTQAAK